MKKPVKRKDTDTAMTKRDLVETVALESNLAQEDVSRVIDETFTAIIAALGSGRYVELRQFGIFEVVTHKPRIGRNPRKPEMTYRIPERRVVKFKPGKRLRDTMAEPEKL